MPEAWKTELGLDWAQVWHTWRHTLGNLTCTAFNSEIGNCSFPGKRDAERGFRSSPLRLNADLRETERWDEPAIRARGARLADLAVDIWRRPVLTDGVLALSNDTSHYGMDGGDFGKRHRRGAGLAAPVPGHVSLSNVPGK